MPELSRQECAAMVVGGPTPVLDLGSLRVVSDPTFDAPGPHGYLTKTADPAIGDDQLGRVDLVLVSHDNHPDNLDDRGRAGGGRPAGADYPQRSRAPRVSGGRPRALDQPRG